MRHDANFSSAQDLAKSVAKATEGHILEQLNDFISRDLIRIEQQGPTFIHEPDSAKITVRTSVRLVLKDKEYIEKLESENAELKNLIAKIKGTLT